MKTNFLFLGILFAAVLSLSLLGCQSKHPKNVLSLNSSLRIPEDQMAQMIEKSSQGDRGATFRLYEHYYFAERIPSVALKWLAQAAEAGHAIAQYNLGMEYSGAFDPKMKDLAKAKIWLQKAADNGVEGAKEQLKQLDANQSTK